MSRKQLIGIASIISFFLICIVILVFTIKPKGDKQGGTPADSYFVQQRIKNIEKSN